MRYWKTKASADYRLPFFSNYFIFLKGCSKLRCIFNPFRLLHLKKMIKIEQRTICLCYTKYIRIGNDHPRWVIWFDFFFVISFLFLFVYFHMFRGNLKFWTPHFIFSSNIDYDNLKMVRNNIRIFVLIITDLMLSAYF